MIHVLARRHVRRLIRLARGLRSRRRGSARLAPGESPGSHLADLTLLCLQDCDRKLLDLWATRLCERHPRGLDGALMVRDHGVDKGQVERRANDGGGSFTIPRQPIRRRLYDMPRFVVTRGGEYCFMPRIRALHWLANLHP